MGSIGVDMDYATWKRYMDADAEQEPDPITETIADRIRNRSAVGMEKYGTGMLRKDVDTTAWIDHAQEEALDLVVYLERLKFDVETMERTLLAKQATAIRF